MHFVPDRWPQADRDRLDGAPIEPVVVDHLPINVGERFDVLLKAEGTGPAWIRAATMEGGEGRAALDATTRTNGLPADAKVEWGKDGGSCRPDGCCASR